MLSRERRAQCQPLPHRCYPPGTGTVLGQVVLQLEVLSEPCVQPGDAACDLHDQVYATSQLCTSWQR